MVPSIALCITNNLIKHQSFVYTQLNDQLYFKEFSKNHLFTHSLMSNSFI